jgi:BirA family transcriptional regulator, biotin operon repressor / biotin---[acetyl-CoA-carboxylase] ligase
VHTEEIRTRIKGTFGSRIFNYESVDSTNTLGAGLADDVEEGAVILAETQRRGRGRLGKQWISPGGNIYMSVVLKPRLKPADLSIITLMTAVACARSLRKITSLDIKIKWPNDLMISGRKVGGILSEISTKGKQITNAVVGIGINVNSQIEAYPDEVKGKATSLRNEAMKEFSREEIVADILDEMCVWYGLLTDQGREVVLGEWKQLTCTLGKEVQVAAGDDIFTGIAEAVDDAGNLLIRMTSGDLRRVSAGDVTMLSRC